MVGTTVRTIQYPVDTNMGTIGAIQETSKKHQECIETQQEGVLKVSDGVEELLILSINGRYWTRTNDPHDVNVVL